MESLKLADQVLIHDFTNLDGLVKKAHALHQVDPFDGVLAFSEEGLLPAAAIAAHLNIPGLEQGPVHKTCNKYLMRKALESIPHLNVPYSLCTGEEDVRDFFDSVGFPFVLKPLTGFGSKGVVFVNSPDEMEQAYLYSSSNGQESVLAEAYSVGTEFSVESFTYKGEHEILAITDKANTGPPHFVGTFHSLPSLAPPELQKMIMRSVKELLDCINLTFGPAHTEVIVTDQGVKIIESQIRPGGRIYHMIEGALGVDIFHLTARKLFDQEYVPKKGMGGAAIFFIDAAPGIVEKVVGLERVREDPSVYDLSIRCKAGDTVSVWKSSSDRLGHLICVGSTAEQAIASAKKMGQELKIVTKKS
ncbi:ATP-grasp domain-containing protein [Brevibacillus humidisoli]|uniref:ATP-grasp domain-containing protein n=1 Tax=Brevibacillus humidisoli TaxID=2895522 RepID=UPI001E299F6F|nr:ATP-grasp domain-containing protein [Brevibacillus humidisoli]UFJ43136.1 ATP-grasp domain-containing protein [Brevibacillus humidisoli]